MQAKRPTKRQAKRLVQFLSRSGRQNLQPLTSNAVELFTRNFSKERMQKKGEKKVLYGVPSVSLQKLTN